jgi:glycerol uptake facilitator-like aquaporin
MTRSERALVQSHALAATESRKRPVAWVEWIATVSLALSTVVAATAVSIGIARADVFGLRSDGDAAPLAIALLIGLLLLAMGGLTAFMASSPKGKV